jgi:hypothetical protein
MKSERESECRCPYCGKILQVVWVHGHGQCKDCGINISPCCQGSKGEER